MTTVFPWPLIPKIPVAWGDVFDKLTILEIKHERVPDPQKRDHITKEYNAILEAVGDIAQFPDELTKYITELKAINERLWEVEDGKRNCERKKQFDKTFIALAREVYIRNDKRAEIKKQINLLMGSDLIEEKYYNAYSMS